MKRLCLLAVALVMFGASLTAVAGEKKMRIAGVIFQEDQFMRLVLIGMRDMAEKIGDIEFVEGNSENKPDKEIQLVNNYTISKIDALLITPVSATSSTQGLKQAQSRGMKVLQWNSKCGIDAPFVESSQYDLGKETGIAARKFITEKLDGKAKIAILALKALVPEQSDARRNGFWDQVKDLPGVELVAEQDAWLPEAALKKSGDIMTANPNLDIIWGANECATVGSVLAVRNAGKAGKVYVFGTDTSEQLLEFIKSDDNILQAITGQNPYLIGQMSMEFGAKMVKGEDVPEYSSVSVLPLNRESPSGINTFEADLKAILER